SFDSVHQKRACVEAVIAHPDKEFVKPLIEVLKKCDPADTHLRLAAKIALRNCLALDDSSWPNFKDIDARKKGFDPIYAEVSLGAPTSLAAAYLLTHLQDDKIPQVRLVGTAEHIAREGDGADCRAVIYHLVVLRTEQFNATATEA